MTDWHIYVDGASSCNPGESGAGIIVFDENGNELFRESRYLGQMTNNMAEYEALLYALKKARDSAAKSVAIYTDSLLVQSQVLGRYKINNLRLKQYAEKAREMIQTFHSFELHYIPREENRLADRLARDAIDKKRADG